MHQSGTKLTKQTKIIGERERGEGQGGEGEGEGEEGGGRRGRRGSGKDLWQSTALQMVPVSVSSEADGDAAGMISSKQDNPNIKDILSINVLLKSLENHAWIIK